MPDLQYQYEKPDPKDLDVEGVEITFGLTGGQWNHWYDGGDPSALADWKHREICHECDSGEGEHWYDGGDPSALADWEHCEISHECDSGEGDRELSELIASQVYDLLRGK